MPRSYSARFVEAFDAGLTLPKGTCVHCGGSGRRLESIDDERLPVDVPCDFCQAFCKACNAYRRKGHQCPARRQP